MGEVLPRLWVGSVAEAHNKSWLDSKGITHVINTAVEIQNPPWPQYKYMHIQMNDHPMQPLLPAYESAARSIHEVLKQGGTVLVHCAMGISRSVSLVLLYLMTHHNMSLSSALKRVVDVRPQACPNFGFVAQLSSVDIRRRY